MRSKKHDDMLWQKSYKTEDVDRIKEETNIGDIVTAYIEKEIKRHGNKTTELIPVNAIVTAKYPRLVAVHILGSNNQMVRTLSYFDLMLQRKRRR